MNELRAGLDVDLPPQLAAGSGTAMLVAGWCSHPTKRPLAVTIGIGDDRSRAMAQAMPRGIVNGTRPGEHGTPSGFWGVVALRPSRGRVSVEVEVAFHDGTSARAEVASIEVVDEINSASIAPASAPSGDAVDHRVAICMATHEPRVDLLARQLDSIRAQTHRDWVCLISDDCSSEQATAVIREAVGDDPRFLVSRSNVRLGFYRNFERALSMVPKSVPFVALCDQDDEWHREKLATLLDRSGDALFAFSDARIVDGDRRVLSETFWTARRPNFEDFAALLLTNSVSGASSFFRRELLDVALPFPPGQPGFFHDHWLALVAAAVGRIEYVPLPLFDYVQHAESALGHERMHVWARKQRPLRDRLKHFRVAPDYFFDHWRVTYFRDYCRTLVFAHALALRTDSVAEPAVRRTLDVIRRSDRSAAKIAWLVARALRERVTHRTLRGEARILRALAWRHLLAARRGGIVRASHWRPVDSRPSVRRASDSR